MSCVVQRQCAKAGALAFFDTLRVEVGDVVGITIAMPGWVESEITRGKFIHDDGTVWEEPKERDVSLRPNLTFHPPWPVFL